MRRKIGKKGDLNTLYPIVMILVLVGILMGIGMIVLDKLMEQPSDQNSSTVTSINETIQSIGDFSGWMAIIVVVVAAAIILGIVLKSFTGRRVA